jgi:hypothetical protein
MMSKRSFDTSIPQTDCIFVSLLADAGSCPGNCSGMEEATGAPSSLADWDPKRLRASGRGAETVMTESPSPLTMLFSRHTNRRTFIAGLGYVAAWPMAARAQQAALPVVGFLILSRSVGANATGTSSLAFELAPKQLQSLHELIPNAAAFGFLVDPAFIGGQSIITDLQAAARTLGLKLVVANARTESDLQKAFASFSQERVSAVLLGNSTLYNRRMEHLAALAAHHALPAIFPYPEFALAGGLIGYGSSISSLYHQLGIYTGRILKGEKPADLPVQQATKLELIINLKTAKAFGLTIPETLLATADEVIQ